MKMQASSISDALRTRALIVIIVAAFIINLIPLPWSLQIFRPDILLLILIYWGINYSQKVSLLAVFLLGVLGDVANGGVLGQTSLLYIFLIFIAVSIHRRIRLFKPFMQILYLFPALLLTKVFLLGLLVAIDGVSPSLGYFLPVISTVIFWPLVHFVIQMVFSLYDPV